MAAVDLPENITGLLLKAGSEFFQGHMAEVSSNASTAHNLARLIAVRNFDEVGTLEGRAVSGVNATPIAGPANAQKV